MTPRISRATYGTARGWWRISDGGTTRVVLAPSLLKAIRAYRSFRPAGDA